MISEVFFCFNKTEVSFCLSLLLYIEINNKLALVWRGGFVC